MPNPAAKGKLVTLRTDWISGASESDTETRSPVTPVRETRYTNPVEYSATSFRRSGVLVGAARKTVSRPASRITFTYGAASSTLRSVSRQPSMPAALASRASFSRPYRSAGFIYVNRSSGISESLRIWQAISSTLTMVVPALRARSEPAWITGPSAIGSENGTPNSIRSAPPRSSAATSAGVRSGDGSPAVKYATSAARRFSRSALNRDWIRVGCIEFGKIFAVNVGVLVTAPGDIDHEELSLRRGSALQNLGYGMGRFKRRNDAFRAGQLPGCRQRFRIRGRSVFGAVTVMQPGVLGADGGVIQTGRNRVRQRNLAIGILKHIAMCPMQHAGRAARESRGVFAQPAAAPSGLDSDQLHVFVTD